MSDVSEQTLPGIGRSYGLTTCDKSRVTVVIRHRGRRDLYVEGESDGSVSVELTDDEARRLGAVLGGAYFKPAVVEEILGPLLTANSPALARWIPERFLTRNA